MKRIFPTTFSRVAVVTALSASLALSPMTAPPAQAGDRDVGAIAAASIFALITAGIISSAANAQNGNQSGWQNGRDHDNRGRNNRHHSNPRKTLPAQCDLTVRKGPDRGTYYGRHCLRRNFDYFSSLPKRCEERVWVPRRGRNVNAYDAQCLERFGYREERTRGSRSSRR